MAACIIKLVMGKIPLSIDSQFVVREDKVLDYILAALFFALFLYGLIDMILHHFTKINYQSFIFMIALAPAFIFFIKGKNKRVYIRINKMGIYQDEKLVTGWSNLLNAFISQKETVLTIQDNFILVLEYRKDSFKQGFRRNIPLTNTQNKSEEDVLAAVNFFWKGYRKDAGM
jgi:branched-subunit amino acid transport protein